MQSTQSAPIAESHAVSGSVALAAPTRSCAVGAVIPFPTAPSAQPSEVVAPETESRSRRTPAPESADPADRAVVSTERCAAPPIALHPKPCSKPSSPRLAQNGHASASQLDFDGSLYARSNQPAHRSSGHRQEDAGADRQCRCRERSSSRRLQRLGGPARFMVIPGEGVASTSAVTAPVAGSIQQAALEHPMVQRAKEIFNAEVRSVVDLRSK